MDKSFVTADGFTKSAVLFSDDLLRAFNLTTNSPVEITQYDDGRIELMPVKSNIQRLKGFVKSDIHLTIEEMNEAMEKAGAIGE